MAAERKNSNDTATTAGPPGRANAGARRLTYLLAALALVVAVGAGVGARGWIAQEYWLHKLESRDPAWRATASWNLVELKSTRAIPALLRLLREEIRSSDRLAALRGSCGSLREGLILPAGAACGTGDSWSVPLPGSLAESTLVRLGAPAVPALTTLLKRDDAVVRLYGLRALGRIGTGARTAAPALHEALRDESAIVRHMAAATLRHIEGHTPAKAK